MANAVNVDYFQFSDKHTNNIHNCSKHTDTHTHTPIQNVLYQKNQFLQQSFKKKETNRKVKEREKGRNQSTT